MTREKAIDIIKCLAWHTRPDEEDVEQAIKVLEQEPILDKIRIDIWDLQYDDEEKSMTDENRADAYNNAIRQVIEIIDIHKAEIEPQENEAEDGNDNYGG